MEPDEYENFDEIANELDIDTDISEPSPDDYYERERDIEGDLLYDDIKALYKKYVVEGIKPMGYYKNSKAKFIDHINSILEGVDK